MQMLMEKRLPAMLDHAFDAAERSDEVLAGLLHLLAANLQDKSLNTMQLELAQLARPSASQ